MGRYALRAGRVRRAACGCAKHAPVGTAEVCRRGTVGTVTRVTPLHFPNAAGRRGKRASRGRRRGGRPCPERSVRRARQRIARARGRRLHPAPVRPRRGPVRARRARCLAVRGGSGLVKVVVTAEQGDEMLLATLGPAETFGELAVLDGGPRSASVVAARADRRVDPGPGGAARSRAGAPGSARRSAGRLGSMVRRLTEQTVDLAFAGLTTRLAKVLMRLAEGRGSAQGRPRAFP